MSDVSDKCDMIVSLSITLFESAMLDFTANSGIAMFSAFFPERYEIDFDVVELVVTDS
jgi:hypothetical protein